MINGILDNFLDNGWEHDTVLYYNGFYYYLNGSFLNNKKFSFFVYRVRGMMEKGNLYCKKYLFNDDYVCEEDLFFEELDDRELVKKHFLEAKIFDGKSFWEVEKDIIWAEDGGNYEIKSLDEIIK